MKEIKALKYWFLSVVIFVVVIALFIVAFISCELRHFLLCAVMIVLFVILYGISNKMITFEEGYTAVQAYVFYRNCKKKGVQKFSGRITENRSETIKEIVSQFDFAKNLDEKQLKELYNKGLQVSQYLISLGKKKSKKV